VSPRPILAFARSWKEDDKLEKVVSWKLFC